jgi:hypothetical protein
MRRRPETGRIAPRFAAVMLVLVAVCGCEKDASVPKGAAGTNAPAVSVSRTKDPVYKKALKNVQNPRKELAAERAKLVAQMEALVARARKALPEGATELQVRDELLNNPRKYPGWRELSRMLSERNALAEKELEDARRLVTSRIMQEQKDLSKKERR